MDRQPGLPASPGHERGIGRPSRLRRRQDRIQRARTCKISTNIKCKLRAALPGSKLGPTAALSFHSLEAACWQAAYFLSFYDTAQTTAERPLVERAAVWPIALERQFCPRSGHVEHVPSGGLCRRKKGAQVRRGTRSHYNFGRRVARAE